MMFTGLNISYKTVSLKEVKLIIKTQRLKFGHSKISTYAPYTKDNPKEYSKIGTVKGWANQN